MIQIVEKSNNTVTITAPVLVPGEKDCDYKNGETPLTPEKVQQIATSFKNYGIIDKNHSYLKDFKKVGEPVESKISTAPMTLKNLNGEEREYPPGTWILTAKITDPVTVTEVKNRKFTGFSVTALNKSEAEKIKTVTKNASMKSRTLIKDLDNPVGFTVSLVVAPCQRGAKFCSIKQKENNTMSEEIEMETQAAAKGFFAALKESFTPKKKEDVELDYVKKEDFEAFKTEMNESISENIMKAAEKAFPKKDPKKKNTPPTNGENQNMDGNNQNPPQDQNQNNAASGLTPAEQKQLAALLKKKQDAEKACGTGKKKKAASKGLPNHDDGTPVVQKSANSTIMEAMGRHADGRPDPNLRK
ncbi:XkdF-like putative serine protease domain-containing protein [Methanobrevibacter sp. UBA337]|uniref:XkdF-like putative serine protease domain-containing protein n=1 Tax=Methanobrevibacter sp. UBA337 TaxID=1915480 RepID=UPI0039B98CCF